VDRLDQLPGRAPAKLTEQRADIVVFACGSPAHADHDSIAIAACKGLPADVLERIDLKITGAMRPEYLRDLAADTCAIIADTVTGKPGEIMETPFIELLGRELPLLVSSTPDQPLDEVVAMAELLRDKPLRGRFIGLGVESVDLTAPPDPHATERLRSAVLDAIVEGQASA
jgi:Ni,Fe-hydrogenase maturation factor